MADDLQGTALQLTYQGTIGSLKVLLGLAKIALDERQSNQIVHGRQSLKSLNNQGRQLESVNLSGEDIAAFRKELKQYNVDFAVMKNKDTGEHTVFFKAQDVDRVYKGLGKCVKGISLDKETDKKPMKDVMDKAIQKAEERSQPSQDAEDRHHKKDVSNDI